MKQIFVTTEIPAFHKWLDAPEAQAFLRNLHRHLFKIEAYVEVFDNDREIEFFALKEVVEKFVFGFRDKEINSCENLAEMIGIHLKTKYISRKIRVLVSEDGENGAIVDV